jgi:hypothetical protein
VRAAAAAGLLGGGALGLARFGLELGKGSLSGPLRALAELHFLHFAALLFLVSGALTWGVSLLTAPPPASAVALLDVDESGGRLAEPWSARRVDMVLSAGLVLAVGVRRWLTAAAVVFVLLGIAGQSVDLHNLTDSLGALLLGTSLVAVAASILRKLRLRL